jgi:hypothetical protein
MITGLSVEFVDTSGGGEHDRVESGGSVGHPCGEGIVGGGGNVADMNAIKVGFRAVNGRDSGNVILSTLGAHIEPSHPAADRFGDSGPYIV